MIIDTDIATGEVTIRATLDEAHEILAALKAVRDGKVQAPAPEPAQKIWKLAVESFKTPGKSYLTAIWFGPDGAKHGSCQCPDNTYRKHFCKHLLVSDGLRVLASGTMAEREKR
jgi:hypothetical protein